MDIKLKSSSGAVLTQGLFFETSQTDKQNAPYTLKDEDLTRGDTVYLSLKRLYLDSTLDDPTEYHFISTYLYSLDHWDKLCDSNFFLPHLDVWRRTRDLRMKSQMLSIIRTEAMSESGKNKYGAAKTILDSMVKEEKKKPPTQPTESPFDADYDRLMTNNDENSTGPS